MKFLPPSFNTVSFHTLSKIWRYIKINLAISAFCKILAHFRRDITYKTCIKSIMNCTVYSVKRSVPLIDTWFMGTHSFFIGMFQVLAYMNFFDQSWNFTRITPKAVFLKGITLTMHVLPEINQKSSKEFPFLFKLTFAPFSHHTHGSHCPALL